MGTEFDTLIIITPADFMRLAGNYHFLVGKLLQGQLIFVGNKDLEILVRNENLGDRVSYLCEDDILPFSRVHSVMTDHLSGILQGRELPRGMTGWYYQQFLKMQYSRHCSDSYYMVWDGDTIPCRQIEMFDEESGIPYLDMKKEYHKEYFDTIDRLFPGMKKSLELSFISEHMLIKSDLMRRMIEEIENAPSLTGVDFWERIIRSIEPEHIKDTAFSEFETYGTYVMHRCPETYKIRRWHSFRLGAEFFDPTTITERDYNWLGKDFSAISFEKNQSVRQDHRNLFDNPDYQAKLTARQMLQIAQEEFGEGYIEEWEDEDETLMKLKEYMNEKDDELQIDSPIKYLDEMEYLTYEKMGDRLVEVNSDQAFLCYENAEFLCPDVIRRTAIEEKKKRLLQSGRICVKKTAIIILSYNNTYLMQRCLESIYTNCNPKSYTLIVLDNHSSDGVTEWLKKVDDPNLVLLLSDENLGFPAGCNAAAAYAPEDEDILLLNNDVRVAPNALFWLRMGLYGKDDIGGVGCISNYTGPAQRVDVTYSFPEDYLKYGAGVNVPMERPYEETCELSGFAALIRRSVWDQMGGLDENLSPGYLEDADLSIRMTKAGYRLLIAHNSFIYHAGSQSFLKTDLESLLKKNKKYVTEKWGVDISAVITLRKEEMQAVEKLRERGVDEKSQCSLLYLGAGCGAMVYKLRYLFPLARIQGIEKDNVVVSLSSDNLGIKTADFLSYILSEEIRFDFILHFDRDKTGYEYKINVHSLMGQGGEYIELNS